MKSCNSCMFFDQNTRFCRINPPVLVNDGNRNRTRWPVIARPNADFCGSYSPKPVTDNTISENGVLIKG